MAKLYRVIIPVSNIDQAQSYYENILGFKGRRVSPERHYFDCEGTILACFDPTKFHEKPQAIPNPETVYIAVDDLNESYTRCVNAKSEVTNEIEKKPWGETSFYIKDPFGNEICFVQRGTEFTG